MMDLDESLRAIYFAPVPLVVLDHNRYIRMLNRPAEALLETNAQGCVGHHLQDWILPTFRQGFVQALNDAVHTSSSKSWSLPIFTRLTFTNGISETGEQQSGEVFPVECSISAWYPTDQMFLDPPSGQDVFGISRDDMSPTSPMSPDAVSPQTTPTYEHHRSIEGAMVGAAKKGRLGGARFPAASSNLLHEAYYTISLSPVQTRERRGSPSDARMCTADVLRDSILHTLDRPIMALSRDGNTLIRNLACDETLKYYQKKAKESNAPADETAKPAPDPEAEEPSIDLSWLTDTMNCFSEDFSEPFPPHKFPIYRAAVLGERPAPVNVGCVATDTGVRRVLRVEGQPIRDAGGFGDHIGGMIQLTDITDEIENRKQAIKKQGHEYFQMVCERLTQLVWVTDPNGYHEWFNQTWVSSLGRQCRRMSPLLLIYSAFASLAVRLHRSYPRAVLRPGMGWCLPSRGHSRDEPPMVSLLAHRRTIQRRVSMPSQRWSVSLAPRTRNAASRPRYWCHCKVVWNLHRHQ